MKTSPKESYGPIVNFVKINIVWYTMFFKCQKDKEKR